MTTIKNCFLLFLIDQRNLILHFRVTSERQVVQVDPDPYLKEFGSIPYQDRVWGVKIKKMSYLLNCCVFLVSITTKTQMYYLGILFSNTFFFLIICFGRLYYGHVLFGLAECPGACQFRCSKTAYKKPCLFFCQKCCYACKCVPPGTYANKEKCPCYNNWKTKRGGPKCP